MADIGRQHEREGARDADAIDGARGLGRVGAIGHDIALLWSFAPLRRALLAYGAVIACLLAAALTLMPAWRVAVLVMLGPLLFLPTEYLIHRFVLHPLIYLDSRWLARVWIRIHYAHHRVPDREAMILASPLSIALIIAVTNPPFMLVLGAAVIVPGAVAVLIPFLFYETVHYAAHQNANYRSAYLRRRRRLHLLHHFHNERTNYGICGSLFDRLAGTGADRAIAADRSPSAMTLGYDDALAREKPFVRIEYDRSLDRV